MERGKPSASSESKSQASLVKKVPSIRAESETQTAVAVRVPSVKIKPPAAAATPESNIDKLVTQEQLTNASVAKKRRMITKKAQGVRTREKTPEPKKNLPYPAHHEDTTTTDEEDVKSSKAPQASESEDIYLEMKKKITEKSKQRDEDDLDIDAIREAQVEQARERRRRSISPFALPSKEEIEKLQRKSSFIDPGNKLLSTVPSYPLTPKDEIDPEIIRKNSLLSEDDIKAFNMLPSPTSPGKNITATPYSLGSVSPQRASEKLKQANPIKRETNQSHLSDQPKPMTTRVNIPPKQPSQTTITNVNVFKQNNNETLTSNTQTNDEDAPIRPRRSKSGTRSQGRTSESEMSEDQSKPKKESSTTQTRVPKPRERRRTIAAIKRRVRERSPAIRSKSATRPEKPLDVSGIEMTQTTTEIIDLLQKARRRSISITEDDLKPSIVSRSAEDSNRQLMTPKKKPSSPKGVRKLTTPKTIKILTKEETMESFLQAQRKSVETERSRRSSGYIDASQSELTSSCYSSSYSEDESDFDLRKKSEELTKKLIVLKAETEHKKPQPEEKQQETQQDAITKEPVITGKESNLKRGILLIKGIMTRWNNFKIEKKEEWHKVKLLSNRCSSDMIILIIFCGFGGLIFRYSEGAFENFYKCGVKRVKRDFIDSLWQGSHNMREEDWKSMARKKLWDFETQLHTAHEAGVKSYSGQKSWSFMNSAIYCLTVVTTIGYGHIAPSTTTGRAITILYAIIGIPLFLILLADFGKLFTRSIKFLWVFVRRLYYTGSCRKVRRTGPVQEVMKGLNMVYEAASNIRRPSQYQLGEPVDDPTRPPTVLSRPGQAPNLLVAPNANNNTDDPPTDLAEDPQTPAPSVFEIDDEFNLPISVAITCLIIYIFMGACIYMVWEEWTFFESFYFVFISMSTIGFGDFVPNHPIYMMCSIVYLVFGMSLTSMCINVVQVKLSDSFRQASAKIGATIGLRVSEEDGSLAPVTPPPVEIPQVHTPTRHVDTTQPAYV